MLLFRPRRYDAVSARISDGLAEVLMLVTGRVSDSRKCPGARFALPVRVVRIAVDARSELLYSRA